MDELEVVLESIAHNGIAIARHEGRPVFIPISVPPFGAPGERVRVRITREKKTYAFGELVEVIVPSAARRAPRCRHYGVCGGCQMQHLEYATQLEVKRAVVSEQLVRIGGVRNVQVNETIPSAAEWAYRSHITLRPDPDGHLSYVGSDGKHLIAVEECPIAHPEIAALAASARVTHAPPGARVRLQVGMDDAGTALGAPIMHSARASTDDDDTLSPADAPTVTYRVRGRAFRVTAGGFFQVNAAGAAVLVDLVLSRIDSAPRVLDLYAGVGLFTMFLAAAALSVTAVEGYAPAAADLRHNCADLVNVAALEGSVERVLRDLLPIYEAAVVDPPRTGMSLEALEQLAWLTPRRIVYVSCDPVTLARDAKLLVRKGYRLLDVQPVDMFPQTYHIETVATFARA